jgi:hypothetical protein
VVLTTEETAELERLQAKAAEPEPQAPAAKIVRIGHEALNVLEQLFNVSRQQVAPGVAHDISVALAGAEDDTPAEEDSQPDGSGAAGPDPAAVSETPIADAAAGAVFGSETQPGEGG